MRILTKSLIVFVFTALAFLHSDVATATPDANTLLLLHLEGTHGSSTIIDSTGYTTWTVGATSSYSLISTVSFKYGTASGYREPHPSDSFAYCSASVSGRNIYVQDEDSSTLEFWLYPSFVATSESLLLINGDYMLDLNMDMSLKLYSSGTTTTLTSSAGAVSMNSWNHIAIVKSGINAYIYTNGVRVASKSSGIFRAYPYVSRSSCALLTYKISSNIFKGYIDEFRISNVARYTGSSYSVPTNGYVNPLDIRFYYTGTGTVAWPGSSLGGSSTSVEVSEFQNGIFDWVTEGEALSGSTEYRAIDIKNDSPTDDMQSAIVWIDTQGINSSIAIAYDSTGSKSVPNETTAPSGLSWSTGTSRATGVLIGDLNVGEKKRLWLRRTVPVGAVKGLESPIIRVEGFVP